MTKRDKLITRFLSRPESLAYLEIETVLFSLGFIKIEAKGSHKKFKHAFLAQDIIIPVHNNDCKMFYKKWVSKIIRKYFYET